MFLMGLTFFHSFFGTTYIMLMPIFAVDILEVGADGQGLLLGVGAVGSLGTALWLATRRNDAPRAWLIIVGCVMSGVSLAAFALTSEYVGSFALAMVMMFVLGVFTTGFTTGTQTSLQMMVPDQFRGPSDGVLRDDLQYSSVRWGAGQRPGEHRCIGRAICLGHRGCCGGGVYRHRCRPQARPA